MYKDLKKSELIQELKNRDDQFRNIGRHEFLIYNQSNTYRIFWSDQERGGWMYDVWENYSITWEQCDEIEPTDGGFCTGSLSSAMEMAGIEI